MKPFEIVGDTQVLALSTTTGTVILDNTGHDYLLIQTDEGAASESIRFKLGGSGVTVSLNTTLTTGVVIHAASEGVIIKRNKITNTHIAGIASMGIPNLYITPVTPIP